MKIPGLGWYLHFSEANLEAEWGAGQSIIVSRIYWKSFQSPKQVVDTLFIFSKTHEEDDMKKNLAELCQLSILNYLLKIEKFQANYEWQIPRDEQISCSLRLVFIFLIVLSPDLGPQPGPGNLTAHFQRYWRLSHNWLRGGEIVLLQTIGQKEALDWIKSTFKSYFNLFNLAPPASLVTDAQQ